MKNLVLLVLVLLAGTAPGSSQTFFPDDPLREEPPPRPVFDPEPRALSELLEVVSHTVGSPGERHPSTGVIPAGGVNTLGEVMDGPWYVNRHAARRLSREGLLRGPGNDHPPSLTEAWAALVVKPKGLRPGILIRDAKDDIYLLRFDPPDRPELATGAEMVSSRVFHALGYHVLENYLVQFERRQLRASRAGEGISSAGARRDLTELDIDAFLEGAARNSRGRYRAVATRVPPEWTTLLGPYQVYGVRTDDPNDVVPHEHRRDQRGLFVFCAWLNHNFMRAMNTLDAVVEGDGTPHIRHYLVDFTATLGSGGTAREKAAWEGHERIYPGKKVLTNILSFGIYTPVWMRASYPGIEGVGRFSYETFDPETWTTNHAIAPFDNRLPDDELWAAKQVLSFTDEDIRTLVSTGEYSDPEAAEWIAKSLIERRNRIGRAYLSKLLPLDRFRLESGQLRFDDLAAEHGFAAPSELGIRWLSFDNGTGRLTRITGAESFEIPRAVREAETGAYFAARLSGSDAGEDVTVYVRKQAGDAAVVGVERTWPGKVVADPKKDVDTGRSRYTDLSPAQKELFEDYARRYVERRGREVTPQEYYDSLTVSERTTFEAITHALMNSALTDENGDSLGTAFDLVSGIERIAGQYYGRSGDQQFRLYSYLHPGARETLEKSREFHFGHENTVYHVGYPASFRQDGSEPTMQFSISEDGTKADIDVDYRSSKAPQALFNGHLTSANSDVREGDNYDRHSRRWSGLVNWWQELFGKLSSDREREERDLLASERPEPPTPLPPDRPRGAAIEEVHDAVQEFLTDWLVRREIDEAADFLSPRAYACLNLDDDMREEALDARAARDELVTLMRYSVERLGDRDNLTEAIDAVKPWDATRVVLAHPFDGDFTLVGLSEEDAAQYLCGQTPERASGSEYYGVIFRYKHPRGAILGLLWSRENGVWRIVSYRVFEQ